MSSTLALASALAEMDRGELARLVGLRKPGSPGNINDPIGLATELLRADSISRAIAPLPRELIAALECAAAGTDAGRGVTVSPAEISTLTGMGLLGRERGETVALTEVTVALREALDRRASSKTNLGHAAKPRTGSGPEGATLGGADASDGAEASGGAGDPEPAADTSAWYAPALTAAAQTAECLRTLEEQPGRLNRNGTVSVATMRAIAESTGIDATHTKCAIEVARTAGLTAEIADGRLLVPSHTARSWQDLTHDARWLELARAVCNSPGEQMNAMLERAEAARAGDLSAALAALPEEYPLLPESSLTAAHTFVGLAEYLGLTVQGRLSDPAKLLLAGDHSGAASLIASELPGTAPGIYVQPDLSVIIPGPLDPADEFRLARFTRPEHIGVASTRRVTESSLSAAIERGLTETDIRATITELSLTELPQPLEYLLSSLSTRLRAIVLHEHHGDEGRTLITVTRPKLTEMLLMDRTLFHLHLQRIHTPGDADSTPDASPDAPELLYSQLRVEHVFAAFQDARYPAMLAPTQSDHPQRSGDVTGSGDTGSGDTGSSDPSVADTATAAEQSEALPADLDELVTRVHSAARADPGTGDFTRLLELAIRDRSPVNVTAEAAGQARTFLLLPVSLSGGRLRATDQAAGVERTLPVSMITGVEPAQGI